jgi:hypothetical protein
MSDPEGGTPRSTVGVTRSDDIVDSQWIAVAGTLGGVIITATVGLLTADMTGRQQKAKELREASLRLQSNLRDERRRAYVAYLSDYRVVYSRAHQLARDNDATLDGFPVRVSEHAFEQRFPDEVTAFSRSYYELSITAGEPVREAADACTNTIWKLAVAAVSGNATAVAVADEATHEPRRALRAAMREELNGE